MFLITKAIYLKRHPYPYRAIYLKDNFDFVTTLTKEGGGPS